MKIYAKVRFDSEIISSLKKGILFPGAKPDSNRWRPIQKNGKKRITVVQRIERQPHLKKYLDPKNSLKPKSVIAKYYRLRKKGRLLIHEENPPKNVFRNVSINSCNKTHIARFQQDIPKDITFNNYWETYKKQIMEK